MMAAHTQSGHNQTINPCLPALLVLSVVCFLAPALAATPQLVSSLGVQTAPASGGNGDSCLPIFSQDGRFVLFASTANNLVVASDGLAVPALVPARFNVFLRDRSNQTTILISTNLTGPGGGNGDSFPVAISTNGQFVLFESSANNLVAGDTNITTDIFVRDVVNGITWLASINTNGLPGNGVCRSSVLTPDGRFVAFVSEASDLVNGDTNKIADVFVRDLQNSLTMLVSVGAQSTNPAALSPASSSESPEITPDGRFVAFSSTATNLVTGVKTIGDIYVRDLIAEATVWASSGMRTNLQRVTGKTSGVGHNLTLSADGKFVAYQASLSPLPTSTYSGIILRYGLETTITDLIHTNGSTAIPVVAETHNLDLTADGMLVAFVANANDVTGNTTSVQVWDAATGVTTSVANGPVNSISTHPVIDPAGRYVIFLSNAANLPGNSLPGNWHVYRRDLQTAITTLVDADFNGNGSRMNPASVPRLSADGRFAAFERNDGYLVANDNNHFADVFVRDLVAGTNELISTCHPALASASPNGLSQMSTFSANTDGRYIAFTSEADNLVSNDTNGLQDVFVRDMAASTNWPVSVAMDGTVGNGLSYEPSISGNGRFVAFTSSAVNLVSSDNSDNNKATDVFVRNLLSGTTALASVNSTLVQPGNKASYAPTISLDGGWLLFRSQATDLVSGSFTGTENLFLRDLQSGTTRALTAAGVSAAAMTPDGRFVAFAGGPPGGGAAYLYVWDSLLATLVYTNPTPGITTVVISPDGNRIASVTSAQLLLSDRAANTNWLVSSLTSNSQTTPRFSADGRWLTYAKMPGTVRQVYLYDLQMQTESLISHDINSAASGSHHSDAPVISPEGRLVAYRTLATNIVLGGDGLTRQIVIYDQLTGTNSLVTASQRTGGPGDHQSLRANFSADGQTLLVQSWAADLSPGDFNRSGDIHAYGIFTAVILPALVPGQGPWISWPFVPGKSYQVQFKASLSDPNWQSLPGSITNIGVKALLQDSAPTSDQRFYRVESD